MRKLLAVLLLVVLSAVGLANGEVSWKVLRIEGDPKVGGKADIVVEATIKEGWHLYSVVDQTKPDGNGPFPTAFESETLKVGDPSEFKEAPLIREKDKGFNKDINFFRGKGTYWVPVTFTKGLDAAKLTVTYQVCNEGTCIPPQPAELDLKAAPVSATSSRSQADATPSPKGEVSNIEDAKKKGLFAFIQLAFTAGFIALLTPCVFPMIPITVSFFSKNKKEGESGIKGAVLYCLGIVGTFAVLGIAVSAIAGATGLSQLANNPWVNLVLAIIFIVLAFSLFGVFEIGLPSKFVNKFDSTGKSALVAPILMGLTFSLTSFTCTLPFVGAVLVGASQGDYFYPALGMVAFSTAFCLPFFFLALFPQLISKLPKSGAWMVTVKGYMGFIELIAAVKFLSSFDLFYELGLITRTTNIVIWVALLALAALYLYGIVKLSKEPVGKIGPLRAAFGFATVLLALWIGSALFRKGVGRLDGYLAPSPYTGRTGDTEGWKKEFVATYDEALAKAKENGKPIFIDFTGLYCTNCRVMERTVFPTKQVQAEFEKFNKVSLYTDRLRQPKYKDSDARNAALQQKLVKTATLPTYVVVKPDGETVVGSTPFMDSADEFAKWLADKAQ